MLPALSLLPRHVLSEVGRYAMPFAIAFGLVLACAWAALRCGWCGGYAFMRLPQRTGQEVAYLLGFWVTPRKDLVLTPKCSLMHTARPA